MADDGRINLALARVKARLKMADTVTGLLWLLAGAVVYLLGVIAIDQASPLERGTRLTLLAVLGGAAAVGLAVILLMPTLRRINSLYAARLIERQAENLFRNSLVSYVELRHAEGIDAAILDAVTAKARADLRNVDIETIVSRHPTRIAAGVLAAVVVLAIVFAATTAKSFSTSLGRAFGGETVAPTATRIIQVLPETPATVVAGDPVGFTCDVGDVLPDTVTLHMTADGREWDVAPMRSDNRRHWTFQLDHVYRNMTFYVRAGDARSGKHRLNVMPLPAVTSVRTRLTYPAYTLLAPATLETGNVEALAGTRVEVTARTNTPPTRPPALVWTDGPDRTPMRVAEGGLAARGSFTVKGRRTYRIRFYDETTGRENPAAIAYRVTALEDRRPMIEITGDLGDTIRVPAGGRLAIGYRAADDYGLDRLRLVWRADAKAAPQEAELSRVPKDRATLRLAGTTALGVADMGLGAGDEAEVWLVAGDRFPDALHEGRSRRIRVTVTAPDSRDSGGSGQETASAGGKGQSDPEKAGQGDGTGKNLTQQQRRDLETMQQTLKKLADAMKGTGEGQSPGDGSSAEREEPKPGASTDSGPSTGSGSRGEQPKPGGDDPGKQADNTPGGPAEDDRPKEGQRTADARIDDRKGPFTESGAPVGTPSGDRRLLETVGADLRKLERQLQQDKVDPELLKQLGWTETELRQFVAEYKDRFGKLAGAAGDDSARARTAGAGDKVTSAPGGTGTAGQGTVTSTSDDREGDGEASAETRSRRAGSRYGRVINAYERSVSRRQTRNE